MGFVLLIMGYVVRVGVQPMLCIPHATRIIEEECTSTVARKPDTDLAFVG
jgi:hypothetical protein